LNNLKKNIPEEEPAPTVGTAPPEPQGPPPPKPGSEEWIYVQEPIDPVGIILYCEEKFFELLICRKLLLYFRIIMMQWNLIISMHPKLFFVIFVLNVLI
jgi:hypothetical protein